jgi:hypothetical protein
MTTGISTEALPKRAKPGHWSGPRLVQGSEDSVRDEPPSPVVGFRSGLGVGVSEECYGDPIGAAGGEGAP